MSQRLDYRTPQPARSSRLLAPVVVSLFVLVSIVALLGMLPSSVIWYIGDHNQRVIAIEDGELTYGLADRPQSLGHWPIILPLAAIVIAPAWLVDRALTRRRRTTAKIQGAE